MKLLDMTKKYGKATYNYPFEPYLVPDGFRGKPSYTYENCIGCTACAVACPSNAMNVKLNADQTKLVWEFNCARCIFCGRCDEVCPTNAISLSDTFEMAVRFDKTALIETGELEVENCKSCKKPFTTKKLISHNIERLIKCGWDEASIEEKVDYIRTCPECKKKQAVESSTKYFSRRAK